MAFLTKNWTLSLTTTSNIVWDETMRRRTRSNATYIRQYRKQSCRSTTRHIESIGTRRLLCRLFQPAWLAFSRYIDGELARRRWSLLPPHDWNAGETGR